MVNALHSPSSVESRMIRRSLVLGVVTLMACSEAPPDGTGGGTGGSGGGATGGSSGGGTGGGGSPCYLGLADISADTTWSGDLTVDCRVIVREGATLTVAEGTTLRLGAGTFDVYGSLAVEGTTAHPVSFVRAGTQPWGPLLFQSGYGTRTRTLSLKHATLTGAGDPAAVETSTTMGAALVQEATDTPVYVQDLTVDGASGVGLAMRGAFAAGSSALTVKGSGSYAMFVTFQHLGTVPSGTYAANAKPAILTGTAWRSPFSESTRITTDATIKKLDVPYVVGTGAFDSSLVISTVQSGPPTFTTIPLVTIEAGVEVRFSKVKSTTGRQTRLNIDSAPDNGPWKALGALKALGTAASPIVFTSNEPTPAPGDWATIALEQLDPRTSLDHVVIAYAGANAGALGACATGAPTTGGGSPYDGDAALQQFMNVGAPSRSPITNSVIRDSAGGGIYRAFSGADVDFMATNTFSNIAWCKQTSVRIGNACVPATCN